MENFITMSTRLSSAHVRRTNQILEMTKKGIEDSIGNFIFFPIWAPCACTLGILGYYDSSIPGAGMGSEKGSRDNQSLDQLCEEQVPAWERNCWEGNTMEASSAISNTENKWEQLCFTVQETAVLLSNKASRQQMQKKQQEVIFHTMSK